MRNKRLPFLIIGLTILAFFVLMAAVPQAFTTLSRKQLFEPWLEPSAEHILGTNSLGYDIFAELVYGARDTLFVGLLSSLLSLVLGVIIGICAAVKGAIGGIFNGLINIFVMLPRLIVILVLSAFFGRSDLGLIFLIAIFGWSGTARSVRAQVIHIKSQPYIEVCKLYGYGKFHTAVHHVLPNLYDVILSRFLAGVNSCIMMESTLSFLGFGDIYYPTWGTIINFARMRGALIRGAYNYLLPPCACIMLLSLSFYFISLYIDGKKQAV